MRPRTVAATALLALAAGCGAPAPATTSGAAPSVLTTTSPPTSAPAPATATATSWVMPDLVGRSLQDAQDAVQELTDYGIAVTTSTDATGAGRMQVLDGDWTVCTQSVSPGTTITPDTDIDFAVVQRDESC